MLRNLTRLVRGFFEARRIVGRFRPDALFLTGGYVSVPVALVTWLRRRPILVYLPDVEPGLAIKMLSRIATRVAVNVEASRQYLPSSKVVVSGYPLRRAFHQIEPPVGQTARAVFGIAQEDKVLLVFGGSRGARTINRALGAILEPLLSMAHVIHISGRLDAQECRNRREALPAAAQARYHLFDYVHEMELALAAADLVVARAGAGTLGEFPFFGLPAILVPYPYAWRYQKVNADYLAERGAAIRLNDEDLREQLWPTVEALFKDEEQLKHMSENARALSRPDAAASLASLLTELAHDSQLPRKGCDDGRH
jgi:UDP-N-acetylglucosamine--N-acetylmuramyl-(pentapeptide) pyrophosphoryl-undecaprenol N-acetylglucosamine transferase